MVKLRCRKLYTVLVAVMILTGAGLWALLSPPGDPALSGGQWHTDLIPLASTASRYTLDWELDTQLMQLHGRMGLDYLNQSDEAIDRIALNLYPNAFAQEWQAPVDEQDREKAYPNGFSPGWVDILSLIVAGEPVNPVLECDDQILWVILPGELASGGRVDIEIGYQIQLPNCMARFGYGEHTISLVNCYPMAAVLDAQGWHTDAYGSVGDPFYSDMAFYEVSLTMPAQYQLAATGSIRDKRDLADGRVCWQISAPAVRDFAAAASEDFTLMTQQAGSTKVMAYCLTPEQGQLILDAAASALAIFERMIGPYPYETLSVVEADFYIGGMEYPNLVMIDHALFTQDNQRFLEEIVVHETAHQWWYQLVGNDQVDQPWVDEALTTYTTVLYYRERYGGERFAEAYDQQVIRPYATAVSFNLSVLRYQVGMPTRDFPSNAIYSAVVYYRGAMMFNAVSQEIGYPAFLSLLSEYYWQYRFENCDAQQLLDLVHARYPGAAWLMNQWLRGL